ncbi:olfactory receptor 13D1-like [Phascolarctos cinereus]|uniref:Olfactory receptor 13D1-like n=1 Tax=Phascolarctos cinereus TaxID=38626 RepID=A0A6P5KZ67_PHACI|nr:olfactory receptor 13D1-like [Phascolarctos cinereus]
MENPNQTLVTMFFLHGLAAYPNFHFIFFLLCLIMYIVILLGNSFLITISILDTHLYTPMYFFLSNLSFLDICYITSSIPMILVNFATGQKSMSFVGCGAQMFFSLGLGSTKHVLLTVMAYDQYVAICKPLGYLIIVNKGLSVKLVTSCWMAGGLTSVIQTTLTMRLSFCGNVIDYLTCEILAVLKLACEDISLNMIITSLLNIIIIIIPVLFVFISYFFILFTILRINSAEGRKKAFSTCSAHLTVVIIFYGTILFMYMKPKSKDSHASDKLIALLYAVVIPMLNPIICSLRNKDIKAAVKKLSKNMFSQKT